MNVIKNSETGNYSNLLQRIEDKGKVIMLLVGLLMLVTSTFIKMISKEQSNKAIKVLLDVAGQVGGIFVSTAGVAFFYDKYREQKQTERIEEIKKQTTNYIKLLSRGIQEKVYVECIDKEFIDIIPREELDKNDDYRFEAMTMKMACQNEEQKQNNPVLIYGSTLGIFDWIDEKKKEKNEINKKALIYAVKRGVHFKLALNTPDAINTNNENKDNIKKGIIINVIEGLKKMIANELSDAKGSIDVRYIPMVRRNSFSYFACNDRKVCVLDFTFEDTKFSQIFDEKAVKQNNESLASFLTKSYKLDHTKGIPCLCYNLGKKDISIIGVHQKQVLVYKKDNVLALPHIKINEKGKIEDEKKMSYNNIYEAIKANYKKVTGCDIQLCEFVSDNEDNKNNKENKGNKDMYFVIGRISSNHDIKENYQLINIFDYQKNERNSDIEQLYHGTLSSVLRHYGIENFK